MDANVGSEGEAAVEDEEPTSPTPRSSTNQPVNDQLECSKEFIRELANDYIHFKLFGRERERNLLLAKRNMRKYPSFENAAKTLRRTSSDMELRNAEFFEGVVRDVNPDTAATSFKTIAEIVLCPDQLNWGRIVSLFVYGGIVAEEFWKSQQVEKISDVEDWLAINISDREDWIDQTGGWDDFSNTFAVETNEEKLTPGYHWIAPAALVIGGVVGMALNKFYY